MDNVIAISMPWGSNLSVNDRYIRGTRPRLRPEVAAWQEELAWQVKSSMATLDIQLGPQVVVDIEMYFPDDHRTRDADNYLKSILDAVECGSGIDDSNFIPFVRDIQHVDELEAGFLIRVYSASFAGRNLTGRIGKLDSPQGATIIVLDDPLPVDWVGTRVAVNLGVIRC